PFNQIQCADMNGWHGDSNAPGWRKMVQSVTELVETETRADPPGAATHPRRFGRLSRWAIAAVSAAGLVAVAGFLMWGPLRKMQAPPSMRSIALLPVRNLSGDPALDATAEALTEDAIDVMGRTGESRVPPLSAILATRAQPSDDLAKGRKLDVRYVVSASLRKASPGLRLSYRVLDTADGHLLSSGDYVNSASDLALAERRLVLKLHYGLGSLLLPRFIADQLARPANDRDPENVHARLMDLSNHLGRRDVPTAERLIAAAKAIPDTTDLKASLEIDACLTYYAMITNGYASSPAQRLAWAEDALDLGARAALLKPTATSPHECRVYAFMALERWDEAMAEAKHNLQMSPNSANAYDDIASVKFARGQFRDALRDYTEMAERHEQGDPLDLGLSHLYLGDYGPAIENFREFEVQSPKASAGPFFNAAALQLSGRRDEALSQAGLYRSLKADDTDWTALAQSHEPAFLAAASRIRHALHQVGLDEPDAGPIAARTDR
ncbi:MAG TPA: hypothetical protein VE309_07780, partial [Caulobacteraceae bacterium]|nr:hypothetical protein [Caulobacteraceae bacterium]